MDNPARDAGAAGEREVVVVTRQDERLWARHHADGMRLFKQGRDAEAEHALRLAAHAARGAGIDDARLACTIFQLAEVARAGHRFAEAEQLYAEALETEERALGMDHPYVAVILGKQARLLRWLGRASEADQVEADAAAIWEGSAPAAARTLAAA
jgi:hypothetical protein